jgi:uncharacterized protein YeaO (DUF488 family)
MIRTKRIYEAPDGEDGFRVLVERLWPRGMRKERAEIDLWMRDAGASPALRKWFGHDPAKWEEFEDKYFHELSGNHEVIDQLTALAREHPVITLLFAAKDEEHNNAVALKQYLDMRGVG